MAATVIATITLKMKFDCKKISIDDGEFGCTVSLSEKPDDNDPSKSKMTLKMSIDEVLASIGQYVLLQRTYPEDEFEEDYYYIETSNQDISSRLKDYRIDLYRSKFLMAFDNELFEISIKSNEKEFDNLKKALKKLTNKTGELIIHD
ncbi:MAG: hypothetical protein WKF97_14300 [Chitinophagaceae bacterium]